MRIKNPAARDGVMGFVNERKAGIDAWIRGRATETVTFNEIRAAFPALAPQLTDGALHEICKALGLEIVAGNE